MNIPVRGGRVAIVDDEDGHLAAGPWYAVDVGGGTYLLRNRKVAGKKVTVYLHRHLCGLLPGDKRQVDHIDGDTMNNSRSNLRVCSKHENARNRKVNCTSTTGIKGVTPNGKRFQARISLFGVRRHLGLFDTAEEAGAAYRAAAAKLHGEFACWTR